MKLFKLLKEQWKFMKDDGTLAMNEWLQVDDEWFHFDEEGLLQTGITEINGKKYFLNDDITRGTLGNQLSGWVKAEDNKTYYLSDSGVVQTGWKFINGIWYYMNSTGVMQTGWQKIKGKWYYMNSSGSMAKGWRKVDDKWYYLNSDGTMAVGEAEIDGISHFFTSKGKWTLMVNPWHALPEDFVPDLVELEGYQVDRQCRDELEAMLKACRNEGFYCDINNSYRSVGLQQYMWNVRIEAQMAKGKTYEQAVAYIGRELAKVNHSEHHTGLAVDISGGDAMYDWLAKNCWEYGFILRYPEDKTSITGIAFEPWHFRYVGTELSLELKELGLCMEEYFDMLTK